jgi:hypothetical protein
MTDNATVSDADVLFWGAGFPTTAEVPRTPSREPHLEGYEATLIRKGQVRWVSRKDASRESGSYPAYSMAFFNISCNARGKRT